MATPPPLISPRLAALRHELAGGNRGALAAFWGYVIEHGTPLVEPAPGGDQHVLVTFLWRGSQDTTNVVVVGGVADQDVAEDFVHNQMVRLSGTDVWFRTYRTRADAHFIYRLSPNDSLVSPADVIDWRARESTFQPDPLNKLPPYVEDDETASIARLPGVAPQPWFEPQPETAAGQVEEHEWYSPLLGTTRTVWVYAPFGCGVSGKACRLLLLFDGPSYIHTVPTPILLDNLIAEGRLPPILLANIGPAHDERSNRDHELGCNPIFVDALAFDLLPWLHQRYHYTSKACETIVGGSSLAGLAAAYAALRHPKFFGNVLSQFGYFSWAPEATEDVFEFEWLAHQFLNGPTLPVRFSMNVGMFDNVGFRNHKQRPSLLLANRHLRDILRAKGYQVAYTEFYGGHDELSKQYTLADAPLVLCGTDVPTL